MQSKFKGKCSGCGNPYPAGEDIHWSREDGGWHTQCWEKKQNELFEAGPSADDIAKAERLGFLKWADVGDDRLLRRMLQTNRSAPAGRPEPAACRGPEPSLFGAEA